MGEDEDNLFEVCVFMTLSSVLKYDNCKIFEVEVPSNENDGSGQCDDTTCLTLTNMAH
jgi:hypothetical protein